MTASDLGPALVAALDEDTIAQLAERMRPYLGVDRIDAPLLTAAQAAERLGLHPKTVARMARDRRLPAVKVGSGWRFHPDQLTVVRTERSQSAPAGRSGPRGCSAEIPASVLAIRDHRGTT